MSMMDRAVRATIASGPAGGSLPNFLPLRESDLVSDAFVLNDGQSSIPLPGCPELSPCVVGSSCGCLILHRMTWSGKPWYVRRNSGRSLS